MTSIKETKPTQSNKSCGLQYKTFMLVAVVVIAISMYGVEAASAVTVTLDKGIGCGPKYWGVKNFQNEQTGSNSFGRDANCNHVAYYFGRNNTAVLVTRIDGVSDPVQDIAWQAIIQGTDPWGFDGDDTQPQVSNGNFNTLTAEKNFNLKTQWVWSNDLLPNSASSNIKTNYLTNLWFQKSSDANKVLVIDFLWDRLGVNSIDGKWKQESVGSDQDPASGLQYYDPFCEKIGTKDVYHYNIVLDDTTNLLAGTWKELTPNINSYINDAFNQVYTQKNPLTPCSSTGIGGSSTRSSWKVIDQETGIELQIFTANNGGRVKGAYSFSELWY